MPRHKPRQQYQLERRRVETTLATRRDQLVGLARYVAAPRGSLRYFGWVGNRNLGDEAMYQAVRAYFQPLGVAWKPSSPPTTLGRWLANQRETQGSLLGGGTLIGGRSCEKFAQDLWQSQVGFAFGTGVRNPTFWDSHPSRTGSLSDWVDVLKRLIFLGVRGPDSASLLKHHGLEAEVIGDPACFYAQSPSHWKPEPRTMGLNIGRSKGLMWGREDEILSELGRFAKAQYTKGWKLEFFVVWPDDLAPTVDIIREAAISDARVHTIYRSPQAYLRLVRRMRVLVGIKLHAVLLAMCAGVPSIMLEYRPKCLDFMRSIQLEEFNLRTDRMTASALSNYLAKALDEGSNLSGMVAARLAQFRETQAAEATRLREILMRNR